MKEIKLFFIEFVIVFIISIGFLGCSTPSKSFPQRFPSEVSDSAVAVTRGGAFTKGIEGPAVDQQGNLYVVNIEEQGTIGIVRPGEEAELWLKLPEGSVGNSIRFDREGNMFVADYRGHKIYSIEMETKNISTYHVNAEMNQPNDFTILKSGDFYLSDPTWSRQKKGNIWFLSSNGEFKLVATDEKAVNGIDVNPDETELYFGDSISGRVFAYKIYNGELIDKRLVHRFEPDTIDGIRTDSVGNLFVVRISKGLVDYISPNGEKIRSYSVENKEATPDNEVQGMFPTNIAFGGPDGRTAFVTIRDGGYVTSFRVEHPGREWLLLHEKQN